MKFIKINNKEYGLKFTSRKIAELNSKGITLTTLAKDMEEMKLNNLYVAFCAGLQTMQHDITLEKTFEIIDEYYEESENKLPKGYTDGTNNFQNMDTELKMLIRLIVQAVLIV